MNAFVSNLPSALVGTTVFPRPGRYVNVDNTTTIEMESAREVRMRHIVFVD